MILSQPELREAVAKGEIRFDPPLEERQWHEASVDLRLGLKFTKLTAIKGLKFSLAHGFPALAGTGLWIEKTLHSSEQLLDHVEFLNGWAAHDGAPHIEILPLPAQAQFLNVIESVFSGMARAVIHNSDYGTVADAQAAITRYLQDRNRSFALAPRRAGRSIWGEERMPAAFAVTNNCKDVRYR